MPVKMKTGHTKRGTADMKQIVEEITAGVMAKAEESERQAKAAEKQSASDRKDMIAAIVKQVSAAIIPEVTKQVVANVVPMVGDSIKATSHEITRTVTDNVTKAIPKPKDIKLPKAFDKKDLQPLMKRLESLEDQLLRLTTLVESRPKVGELKFKVERDELSRLSTITAQRA